VGTSYQLSRRDFLKISIPVSGLLLLGRPALTDLIRDSEVTSLRPDEKAMLYDASKCIGCRACENACRIQNHLPPESTCTLIESIQLEDDAKQRSFRKCQCMHCTEATCVKVCPTKALTHHELGFIAYNRDRCIGCGYCTEFCPFQIPRLSGNKLTSAEKMDKCDFCMDRVTDNRPTACVEACAAHALTLGNRADLIMQGKKTVAELTQTYPNATFYGEGELGGLHVMYVLEEAPAVYRLPEDPHIPVAAVAWKDVIRPLGWAMGGLTILGLGLNYIVARKAKLARELPSEREK
jgi:formate dehydrogenase iron-sulfur subunit